MNQQPFQYLNNAEILFVSKTTITTPGGSNSHHFSEITYVMSGSGTYMIGEDTYHIRPFDFFIVEAHQLHHCISVNPSEPLTLFTVAVSCEKMPYQNAPIQHTSPTLSNHLFSLIETMRSEWKQKNSYYPIKVLSCFLEFIVTILRDSYVSSEPSPQTEFSLTYKEQRLLNNALIYIKQHFAEPISVKQIADSIPVSTTHLSRLFQKATSTSPMQHVIYLRLKKACSILEQKSSIPIKEVSKNCGFKDPYHFSKLFKKHVGVTPTEYKMGKRVKKF